MSDYKFGEPNPFDGMLYKNEQFVIEPRGGGPVGWTCHTEVGTPIYRTVEDAKSDTRVADKFGLKIGDELIIQSLVGWYRTKLCEPTMAETEDAIYPIRWCDRRECWVCDSCIMKSAIKALANMELK